MNLLHHSYILKKFMERILYIPIIQKNKKKLTTLSKKIDAQKYGTLCKQDKFWTYGHQHCQNDCNSSTESIIARSLLNILPNIQVISVSHTLWSPSSFRTSFSVYIFISKTIFRIRDIHIWQEAYNQLLFSPLQFSTEMLLFPF